jgi:integrase
VLALLSKIMNRAEQLKVRPQYTNPCRHVERMTEKKRKRYLDPSEITALARAMADAHLTGSERPEAITAIRLLICTGARKSEILNLRWRDVHIESGELRLPDSKTGEKVIHLSGPAIRALEDTPAGNPGDRVIKATRRGKSEDPKPNIDTAWRRIRAAASLDDVRLHDLRHSFASLAIAGGASLSMIGALLGHADVATTARYAHLADDAMKVAAGNVGAALDALMGDPKAIEGTGV